MESPTQVKPDKSIFNANTNARTGSSTTSSTDSQSNHSDISNSSIDIDILIDNLLLVDWEKIKNCDQSYDKSVVNLSSHILTPSQRSLLKKGLTFCPMPGEIDIAELKNDLYKFEKNLKWKLHWAKRNSTSAPASAPINNNGPPLITIPQDSTVFEHRKFKNKSKAQPPISTPNIETMFHLAHRDLDKVVPKKTKFQNLTREENRAIFELKSNPDIVIKKADKGSAIVIQNTQDYVDECKSQLNDTEFYELQHVDHTELYRKEIEDTLLYMKNSNEISEATFNYLNTPRVRIARFYTLPKIHKRLVRPPGRPIVSANQSPTERISQFVDHFLNPIMKLGKSFIKDTPDFLRKLEKCPALPRGAYLVTLDVQALYPSIPQGAGIWAVSNALKKYRTNPNAQPSNGSIIKLLNHVLTKNNFVFNGEMYHQIKGTAMGTKCAPAFANIYMNQVEEKYVYTHTTKPLIWLRFIDDIFCVFTCSKPEIEAFVDEISEKSGLKFTATISDTQVDFLDTTVKVDENGKLYTTLYSKPTDTHDYLLYNSAHPKHCKNATPFSQLLRVRKICKKDMDFLENSEKILGHFYRRGYPLDVLKSALNAVKGLDRDILLIEKPKNNTPPTEQSFFLTTTYNPASPNLKGILGDHWDLVGLPPHDLDISLNQVKQGFRRCPNLKDKLCNSTIEWPPSNTRGGRTHWDPKKAKFPCPRPRACRICPKMRHNGRIVSQITQRTYYAPVGANCQSNNLIYLISCKKCPAQYVGETYRKLGTRMSEHMNDVTKKHDTTVAHHFSSNGHCKGDMIFEVISYVYLHIPPNSPEGIDIRRSVEKKWIHKLKTSQYPGLNVLD